MVDTLDIDGKAASIYQERLFSRLQLGQVFELLHAQARDQFERVKGKGDIDLIVERVLERHRVQPLHLSREIEWVNSFTQPGGEIEHQFAVKFSGTSFLWHLSPSPDGDGLPAGQELNHWYLPHGETLRRPYGEIFGDRLLVVAESMSAPLETIDEINSIIAQQRGIIAIKELALERDLCRLAGSRSVLH